MIKCGIEFTAYILSLIRWRSKDMFIIMLFGSKCWLQLKIQNKLQIKLNGTISFVFFFVHIIMLVGWYPNPSSLAGLSWHEKSLVMVANTHCKRTVLSSFYHYKLRIIRYCSSSSIYVKPWTNEKKRKRCNDLLFQFSLGQRFNICCWTFWSRLYPNYIVLHDSLSTRPQPSHAFPLRFSRHCGIMLWSNNKTVTLNDIMTQK